MAVTTMELMELLRKVDGGDIDFLREGVGVLAQAPMDAEVSAQIGAEHGQRTQPGPPTATATGPGTGTPGSARSTCRSPGSVRGAIRPASWSRAGTPSGRWPRSWPSAMWRACRPDGSRTSPRRWHHQPVEVPGLPGLRRARRARGSVAQPAVGRRPVRVRRLDALVVKVREARPRGQHRRAGRTGVNADGHREILGLELGAAEDGAAWTSFLRGWSPAACPGSSWWSLTPLKG
jgi:putative transposase